MLREGYLVRQVFNVLMTDFTEEGIEKREVNGEVC